MRWWTSGAVVVVGSVLLAACGNEAVTTSTAGSTAGSPSQATAPATASSSPSAVSTASSSPASSASASVAPGAYVEYAEYRAAPGRYAGTRTVLFFHAPWCPTCRAAEKDILARRSALPEGLTIVKVDYDSATELKQKYGVTRQSTFVQVDAGGAELAQFQDAISVDAIVSQLA